MWQTVAGTWSKSRTCFTAEMLEIFTGYLSSAVENFKVQKAVLKIRKLRIQPYPLFFDVMKLRNQCTRFQPNGGLSGSIHFAEKLYNS